MRILLTNDDGISAPGIKALWDILRQEAEVFVVAPSMEQSASSQAITVHHPIRVDEYNIDAEGIKGWSVGGTPTDCVKLALASILDKKPDIVISGINLGANLGSDVLYSGTVSAAIEGALHNIPAIAVSLDLREEPDFSHAASFTYRLARKLMQEKLPSNTLLNVNVPSSAKSAKEMMMTQLGVREYINTFDKRTDPRGRCYYWMGGQIMDREDAENTDVFAVKNGKISVTPIHFDLTNYPLLKALKNWQIN